MDYLILVAPKLLLEHSEQLSDHHETFPSLSCQYSDNSVYTKNILHAIEPLSHLNIYLMNGKNMWGS
jgi:hypothetical protein